MIKPAGVCICVCTYASCVYAPSTHPEMYSPPRAAAEMLLGTPTSTAGNPWWLYLDPAFIRAHPGADPFAISAPIHRGWGTQADEGAGPTRESGSGDGQSRLSGHVLA